MHPEVVRVVSQLGRPDDGTDLAGFNNLELFAPLEPFEDWPRGLTKDKLTDEITGELQKEFPGVIFNFSQYISDNVEEAVSGVKGENSVKVVGPDLATNDKKAAEIAAVMSKVDGVKDLGVFKSLGQPDLKIAIDRVACERYGLNTGDVNAVIQGAIGGTVLSQVYEGEQHYDLRVRWTEPYRKSLDAIRHITVATPDGSYIPLEQLADIRRVEGPAVIYRQEGYRYTPVKFSVRGRDLASTIEDAKRQIDAHVKLPYDTHLVWEGQINEMNQAFSRLAIIVPLTLLLIMLLVYRAAGNVLDLVIILIDIPVACTGGVLALLLTGTNFSASAAMGFVSVFGIAVQDALLMVSYFQQLHYRQGLSVEQAARLASERRFRPVLMTTLVATLRSAAGGAVARHRGGHGSPPRHRGHRRVAPTRRPHTRAAAAAAGPRVQLARGLQAPPRATAHDCGFASRRTGACLSGARWCWPSASVPRRYSPLAPAVTDRRPSPAMAASNSSPILWERAQPSRPATGRAKPVTSTNACAPVPATPPGRGTRSTSDRLPSACPAPASSAAGRAVPSPAGCTSSPTASTGTWRRHWRCMRNRVPSPTRPAATTWP